ncbi:MAG TPA: hypothetical protein VGB18_06490 [Candidatus Thermoplasmatota archaeon]
MRWTALVVIVCIVASALAHPTAASMGQDPTREHLDAMWFFPHLEEQTGFGWMRKVLNTQQPEVSAFERLPRATTWANGMGVQGAACLESVWNYNSNPLVLVEETGDWRSSEWDYSGFAGDLLLGTTGNIALIYVRPNPQTPIDAAYRLLEVRLTIESGSVPGRGTPYAEGHAAFPAITNDEAGILMTFLVPLQLLETRWPRNVSSTFVATIQLCIGHPDNNLEAGDFVLDNRPGQWNRLGLQIRNPGGTATSSLSVYDEALFVRGSWTPTFGPNDLDPDSIDVRLSADGKPIDPDLVKHILTRRVGSHHDGPMRMNATWKVALDELSAGGPWNASITAWNRQHSYQWSLQSSFMPTVFAGEAVPGTGTLLTLVAAMSVAALLHQSSANRPRR